MNEEAVIPTQQPEVKIGRLSKGWLFIKGSWHALLLDKEVLAYPILGILASLPVVVLLGVAEMNNQSVGNNTVQHYSSLVILVVLYVILTIINAFFASALIASVLYRFNGGDPTVGYGLSAAKKRFGSIALFALVSATVGLVLRFIGERLPFAGWIITRIINAAWSFATIFALPIIVTSPEPVSPNKAVIESASLIKRVWMESVVISLGIGFISFLMILGTIIGFSGLGVAGALLHLPTTLGIVWVVLGILSIIVMAFVLSTLSAIAQAAVYHYAVTGESPLNFDKRLLQAAMTPKKARRLFS